MTNDQSAAPGAAPTWVAWAISAVNGVIGDYLQDRRNGLAIDMAFFHDNRPLPLSEAGILQAYPQPSGKICILVHGLGCHEGIWAYPDPEDATRTTSYGALFQSDFGYTPLFVRYNTGLSLAENGKRFAALLDTLAACYPVPIETIVLIGHSMGGLIIRAACHAGVERQAVWVGNVHQIFYLGTPHDGAPLARLGHVTTTMLHALPHPITKLIGDVLNRRSQGVKDLRLGPMLDDDVPAPLASASPAAQQPVPWLTTAQHYLIFGMLANEPDHAATHLFGDGLVRVPHMHTHVPSNEAGQAIPRSHVRIFAQIHHMRLAYDPEVYQQIRAWCQSESYANPRSGISYCVIRNA